MKNERVESLRRMHRACTLALSNAWRDGLTVSDVNVLERRLEGIKQKLRKLGYELERGKVEKDG